MKKKINRKGFTLVELLAVVVILLAISVIAISSISAAIERQNDKKNDATEKFIKTYAELYFDDYKNTALNSSNVGCITVTDLKTKYNLDDESLRHSDGYVYGGCVSVNNGSIVFNHKDSADGSTYYSCENYACKENHS